MTTKSRSEQALRKEPEATRLDLEPTKHYKKVVKLRLVHNDVAEACACRCVSHCSCDCDRVW